MRRKVDNTTDLWEVVDDFAQADEADRQKREDGDSPDKKKRPDSKDQGRRSVHDRIQRGPIESRLGPRGNSDPARTYPLTKSRTEIFELHTDLFAKPRPMSNKPKSKNKYCSFHEDYGHDTEECQNLKAEVNKLVGEGTLKKYRKVAEAELKLKGKRGKGRGRKNARESKDSSDQSGSCGPRHHKKKRKEDDDDDDQNLEGAVCDGIVATITGLPHNTSKSSLKADARSRQEPVGKRLKGDEVITFSEKDPVPTITPHQDAIVIQATIANKLVYRVYIDSGASVSILSKDCFSKLGIDETRLSPAPVPLRSFVQKETRSDGVIALPISVGSGSTYSTKVIQFFVVDAYSPYNIILGRDWLNSVRAVCSTYHLTIKFPTKNGIAVVRGDQKRAKECMHIALKGCAGTSAPHAEA